MANGVSEEKIRQDREYHQYVRTAYETVLEDIKFFKNQQWKITNYVILIYAGLIYLIHIDNKVYVALIVNSIIIVVVVSVSVILLLQNSLRNAQDRKDNILEAIDNTNIGISEFFSAGKGRSSTWYDKWSIFFVLLFAIIFGAAFVGWLICINYEMGVCKMIDSVIAFIGLILPPLLAVFLTHLFIKFKMPQIEIEPEKKEGGTFSKIDFSTGKIQGEFRAWRFLISNKKMPVWLEWLAQRDTAMSCTAKIRFVGSKESFIMQGRWANSPQITQIGEQDRVVRTLFPDPINIRSGQEETLDCIAQFPGDRIAYGWNNQVYSFADWKIPAYSLEEGQYNVFVTVTPLNGKEVSAEFKLTVDGDLLKTSIE